MLLKLEFELDNSLTVHDIYVIKLILSDAVKDWQSMILNHRNELQNKNLKNKLNENHTTE